MNKIYFLLLFFSLSLLCFSHPMSENQQTDEIEYYLNAFNTAVHDSSYERFKFILNPTSQPIKVDAKFADGTIIDKMGMTFMAPTILTLNTQLGAFKVEYYRAVNEKDELYSEIIFPISVSYYNRSESDPYLSDMQSIKIELKKVDQSNNELMLSNDISTIEYYSPNNSNKSGVLQGVSVQSVNGQEIKFPNKEHVEQNLIDSIIILLRIE